MNRFILFIILLLSPTLCLAQMEDLNRFGDDSRQDATSAFRNDSTKKDKEIPIGLKTWNIDKKFGDITYVEPDTASYAFMNTIFTTGKFGEYTTTGNLGAPRMSRIFTDRNARPTDFFFTDAHDFFLKPLDSFEFTNTLSPIANILYAVCGDKQTGEDILKTKFAVNVNKQLGFGFNLDYLYGLGYYNSQNTSHFAGSIYGSYLGDRYNAHLVVRWNHEKISENGGIVDDNLITHPEQITDDYRENEIPTMLSNNWNRIHSTELLFSHRYMVGFNRKVPMTEEEIKAKRFALQSKQDNDTTKVENAEPVDTTWMKNEYVPVTSFIHTLELNNFNRRYIAQQTPTGYYSNNFISAPPVEEEEKETEEGMPEEAPQQVVEGVFDDESRWLSVKNTLAVGFLEGFNKWAKFGLKGFVTHDYRRLVLPTQLGLMDDVTNVNEVTIGGQVTKRAGDLFHFDATGEFWLVGPTGDFLIDANADLNMHLFGDTVRVLAKAFIHNTQPGDLLSRYHSHAFWWENNFDKMLHNHLEGSLALDRTKTQIRIAFDNIEKYTYLATNYTEDKNHYRLNNSATVLQTNKNLSVFTAQLYQDFQLGILHWNNILTYQHSSDMSLLPVPSLNIYSSLFLRLMVARVLKIDLGADVRFFTKYRAPEYVPGLSAYAVRTYDDVDTEKNPEPDSYMTPEMGNYPIINVYANMLLKGVRFFAMMSHVNASSGGNYFLAPHYPINTSVFRLGVSWTFNN